MRVFGLFALCAFIARAGTVTFSYTGALANAETAFVQPFTLSEASDVEIETFGFGGGVDAAGTTIPPGGFDPLIALFAGTGSAATILTDTFGNPVAAADTLTNFIANCPPAGTVTIGASSVCGDVFLDAGNLPAGDYTLLLSDANYLPFAVDPGPPVSSLLSDGFLDLTGGDFQTCSGDGCITPNGNYAVDLIEQTVDTPEPPPAWLLLPAFALIAMKRTQRRTQ